MILYIASGFYDTTSSLRIFGSSDKTQFKLSSKCFLVLANDIANYLDSALNKMVNRGVGKFDELGHIVNFHRSDKTHFVMHMAARVPSQHYQ